MEKAFVGVVHMPAVDGPIAVYSRGRMHQLLLDQGMEDPQDWIDYNIDGFHLGDYTPILIDELSLEEAREFYDEEIPSKRGAAVQDLRQDDHPEAAHAQGTLRRVPTDSQGPDQRSVQSEGQRT
jgi:hypothetical protein